MTNKRCENCIWFEECGCDQTCEHHTPVDTESMEIESINSYNEDLNMRHEVYLEQILEQDA